MKRILLLLIMLTMCWAVCLGQDKVSIIDPPPPPNKDNPHSWKELSSPEGRFSILLPGTPVAKIAKLQTSAGMVNRYVYTLTLPESFYLVSYLDYPVYSNDDEWARKVLDAGRNGILAGNHGAKLLDEKQIAIGNFSGREYLTLQDQFSFGIMRAFVVGGRLYQVAILVPVDVAFKQGQPSLRPEDRTDFYESIASRFFDSLKISAAPPEPLGEVDRMLLYLKEERKDVIVMYAASNASASTKSTAAIVNGKAVHLVAPPYPAIARNAHASGQVSIRVVIDLEGKVNRSSATGRTPSIASSRDQGRARE